MKKLLVLVLMAAMLASVAAAEDLGVQMIGGPDFQAQPISLDDLQLGQSYSLDGYARVKPVDFKVIDYFGQFAKDADYYAVKDSNRNSGHVYYQEKALKGDWANYKRDTAWQDSGKNADFIWLKMDVTNLQKSSVPFMKEITVKVVYDEEYEFAGWVRQINYDYNEKCYRYGMDTYGGDTIVLNPANEEAIDMMYRGTYIIGCTLPNSVFEDEDMPLRVEINMGGNELTYNIRK